MSWGKIIAIALTLALVVSGGVYAYSFFEAPEDIDPITEKWEASGHADPTSESFVHWDEDEPPEIPTSCAKCHSLYGYHDWLGVDGTAFREVNDVANVGTVLYCNTCHNEVGHNNLSVLFPSGEEVIAQSREANCMRCHQGRTWTGTVDEAIAGIAPDETSEELSFINVHYHIAAATRWADEVKIGYQYDGVDYVGFYEHVEDYDECTECHDPHSLAIAPDACAACHSNVVDYGDLFDIREAEADFDGDGNVEEGIAAELDTFEQALYSGIQTYAADVIGTPIIYADSFPYWFIDSNGNGEADDDEVNFGNQYDAWTPRLVRTTYNYHYYHEDPGAFTHNAAYVFQLMYDAMADLSDQVTVDMDGFQRP
jgi:hypothetical protein